MSWVDMIMGFLGTQEGDEKKKGAGTAGADNSKTKGIYGGAKSYTRHASQYTGKEPGAPALNQAPADNTVQNATRDALLKQEVDEATDEVERSQWEDSSFWDKFHQVFASEGSDFAASYSRSKPRPAATSPLAQVQIPKAQQRKKRKRLATNLSDLLGG